MHGSMDLLLEFVADPFSTEGPVEAGHSYGEDLLQSKSVAQQGHCFQCLDYSYYRANSENNPPSSGAAGQCLSAEAVERMAVR